MGIAGDRIRIGKDENGVIIVELIFLTAEKQNIAMSWEITETNSIPRDLLAKIYVYDQYVVDINKW